MNTHVLASSRRRSTFVAVAFAAVVGTAALVVADRTDTAIVAPVSTAVAAPVAPAATLAAAALPAAPVAAADHETIVVRATPAPAEATPDPLADVIVEPVDPAEALFGDHAAVAVSN